LGYVSYEAIAHQKITGFVAIEINSEDTKSIPEYSEYMVSKQANYLPKDSDFAKLLQYHQVYFLIIQRN
jgi:hypothetical protein